jgi:integrase
MKQRTRAEKFPLTVKSGSSSVKIYQDKSKGTPYYTVAFYLGGKRKKLNFCDIQTAKREASAKAAQLSRGDIDAAQLNGKDRLMYGRALDAVRTFETPLDAAAIEYAEARKILKGYTLIEAARFYMKHHGEATISKLVQDAFEEFKKSKSEAKRSDVYLKDIGYRVGSFAKAFNLEMRQLTPQDVADWLSALKLSARSFNNFRLALQTFFKFCQSRKWLSADVNLLAQIERRSGIKTEIEIFTPGELKSILTVAPARLATCIALQAFAGIRTAELFRLTWSDLERRKGHIEITAGKAKTASRRLIPITKNLEAWLKMACSKGSKVWPVTQSEYYSSLAEAARMAEEAKLKTSRLKSVSKEGSPAAWKKNALRHSFISYRLAESRDVAAVALEAGNSPKMIFEHYRELVTPNEAKEWFGILPASKTTEPRPATT